METKELSFEESIKKLEAIVRELENGETSLDKAIDKYKEAMQLAKNCDKKLKNAEDTVNKMVNKNLELDDFKIDE